MRRPVILDGNPFIHEYYRKNATTLFGETGGNTGNLAFRFALASHLENPVLLPWHASLNQIRDAGDIVVLPLANQLGAHTNLADHAEKLEQLGMPVIGIGLGAQMPALGEEVTLSKGTKAWLDTMAALAPADAPNIGVRGEYTASQIAKLGRPAAATVTGCPSNFINMSDDIAAAIARGFKRKIRRVAVAAGIQFIPELASIEADLAEIVTATNGAYIAQHSIEMVQLVRGEAAALDPEMFALSKAYIRPQSTDEDFIDWLQTHGHAFFDARAWMDFLRGFDFVIGTRFHGIMLAIQAGIPAGCIAHDSRTVEMCETMGVPYCHPKDIKGHLTLDNILDLFKFDDTKYRILRQHLWRNYLAVLENADLAPSNLLKSLQN